MAYIPLDSVDIRKFEYSYPIDSLPYHVWFYVLLLLCDSYG
jgi:hypothetical protein